MPLPDERPRQSVANLIGRFEQQTKRPVVGSPRNSGVGVVSHSTGDSANEESPGKEKREWPPKPVPLNDKPPLPIIPSSSWTRQLAQATPQQPVTLRSSNGVSLPLDPPANDLLSSSTPTLGVTIVPEPEPLPTSQGQSDQASATAQPISKPSQRSPTSPVRAPAPRRTTTPKASLGIAAKSPPKTSLGTTTRPLKPQLTGQSTMSSATTTPRQSKATTRTAPSTPSQKNNVSSPKPPSSTTSRPKTPSSGLFAPTAASLARARNAAPQLPTSTKKATLSSEVADRLSKPTAASLSKARSAQSAAASPPRTIGKTARGGSRVAAKPKAESVAGKMAQEKQQPAMSAADVALQNEQPENGHGIEVLAFTEHAGAKMESDEECPEERVEIDEESSHDVPESLDAENVTEGVEFGVESSISHGSLESSPPSAPEHDSQSQSQPDPQPEPQAVPPPEPAADLSSDLPQLPDVGEGDNEVKPPLHVGNEIETMVNLLESVSIPKVRRLSLASIPDDVHEIPDED